MRLTLFYFILIVPSMISCSGSKSDNSVTTEDVPMINFLSKIKMVSSGYKYDLIQQDGENYYRTNKRDSLYFPEFISVMGYLPDTSKFYSILYLEPGDDLYPSLKVFSKDGKPLASKTVSYADCASGNCEIDSCASSIEVIDQSSVKRSLLMISTQCDTLGNKIQGQTSQVKKNQVITVGTSGDIQFGSEKLD